VAETGDDEGNGTARTAPLVVIGASAGGVEALSTLVSTLPAGFPAPVVIAQHVAPDRVSHLGEILAARSALPVRTVTAVEPLAPGTLYVIPADRDVEITNHSVGVEPGGRIAPQPSIDRLLASAAQIYAEDLVAVVLTGSGSDGAAGAQAVKAHGGTVIVQNPETASFPWMPLAVPPSAVDIVAELEAIGPLLTDLLSGAYVVPPPGDDGDLRAFLGRIRERTGLDFGAYKRPTIARRLQQRMAAVGTTNLGDYRRYVERNPDEMQRLVASFLIKVTEFFRDPDLFEHLRHQLLPPLVAEARERGELRLWSAGCATGEEPYTLAMLVTDLLGDELDALPVRIFATDIATEAVDFARRGVYPEGALANLPPDLVERHFQRLDGAYEVRKPVRSLVVFGEHDLGHRAPFPRIDLVLCRNVLIYFTPELQRRALQLFAFSLRRGGYLVLGKAETVSPLPELFALDQPRLKIFRRIGEAVPIPPDRLLKAAPLAPTPPRPARRLPGNRRLGAALAPNPPREPPREPSLGQRAARLLDRLPVGVVTTDANYHIRTINGAARRLLGIHSAAIGEDLIHRAAPVLAGPLRLALDAAFRGETTVARHRVAEDVLDDGARDLEITCYPAEPEEGEEVIASVVVADATELARCLREADETAARLGADLERQAAQTTVAAAEIRELRAANQALAAANAKLRAENDDLLVANEEAQAAAEEIETLNEELQATNEELETLNEELQATVEELTTTNDELQARGIELQELAATQEAERASLAAVLAGIADAVLVLDRDGRVILTNDAYRRIFGADAGFRPAGEDGEPLPPAATPQRRAAAGETFNMTFTLTDADGNRRWYEATGHPLQHDGGPPGGVVAIRDITERSLRQLQDEWLAVASHELRTPLTALQGTLQLAERRRDDPERVTTYLGQAIRQARRLTSLIEELVDTVRLQTGRLVLRQEPIDLATVVRQAVETAQALQPERRIELATPPAGATIRVEGDAARLEQVVLNLLTNALTHAPHSERIDVRLAVADGVATIEVQDYGPGIPADQLDRIFARYYQARPGVARRDGLGLGLFIAQEITAAHGGTIEARSTVGAGTSFVVRLPLLATPLPAVDPPPR